MNAHISTPKEIVNLSELLLRQSQMDDYHNGSINKMRQTHDQLKFKEEPILANPDVFKRRMQTDHSADDNGHFYSIMVSPHLALDRTITQTVTDRTNQIKDVVKETSQGLIMIQNDGDDQKRSEHISQNDRKRVKYERL